MADRNRNDGANPAGSGSGELDRLLEASVHRIGNEPEDPSSMGSYDEVAEEDTDRVGDPDHSEDGTTRDPASVDNADDARAAGRTPGTAGTGLDESSRDVGADHNASGIRRDVDRDARLDERTDFLDAEQRPNGGDLGTDEPRR